MKLGLGIGIGFRHSRIAVGTQWDADAADYLARVAIADGQALEPAVAEAVNDLFVGCKHDAAPIAASNWEAMAGGFVLIEAGPRTLAGTLVPLLPTMPTPTNIGFVPGDYHRKEGRKGDGATKVISTNYFQFEFQDDAAAAVWLTEVPTGSIGALLGQRNGGTAGTTNFTGAAAGSFLRLNCEPNVVSSALVLGLNAIVRDNASSFAFYRTGQALLTHSQASDGRENTNFQLYGRNGGILSSDRRIFSAIGRAVNAAALDARLAAYRAAIHAAIP